jgi:hypothetical protein
MSFFGINNFAPAGGLLAGVIRFHLFRKTDWRDTGDRIS